jgi:hypothetical protein
MNIFEPIESEQEVVVPGVGRMSRVELLSPDGEVLEIHYRWPTEDSAEPESSELALSEA